MRAGLLLVVVLTIGCRNYGALEHRSDLGTMASVDAASCHPPRADLGGMAPLTGPPSYDDAQPLPAGSGGSLPVREVVAARLVASEAPSLVALGADDVTAMSEVAVYRTGGTTDRVALYPTGDGGLRILAGPFGANDGLDRVLVLSSTAVKVLAFASGTFVALTTLSQDGGTIGGAVLADLDRDGAVELVTVTVKAQKATLHVFYGSGQSQTAPLLAEPGTPIDLAVYDADGDCAPDVVVALDDELELFRNVAGRPMLSQQIHLEKPVALGAGDFDADGHLDLVNLTTSGLLVFGAAPAPFGSPRVVGSFATSGLTALVVGDPNRDGIDDFAAWNDTTASLGLGTAPGDLGAAAGDASHYRSFQTSTPPVGRPLFFDVDRDGKLDLVWGTASANGPAASFVPVWSRQTTMP